MKIIQLTPGSGDVFYCENCLRDALLVKSWRRKGYDALVVPLYLPLSIDDTPSGGSTEIFMGGINVYLQQKIPLFRKTPRWVDKLFDNLGLLHWAAKWAGSTSASKLGDTTLSMLAGEQGRQVKELDRLANWLAGQEKPEVICLSNALLAGMARRLKQATQVPVVCFLQDEDEFLDQLPEPYCSRSWELLRRRSCDIDMFIAPGRYFADMMQERLGLPADKINVVPVGIDPDDFSPGERPPDVPIIGFLSRLCEIKGLDILVEVFVRLHRHKGLSNLRLHLFGGKTSEDDALIGKLRKKLNTLELSRFVEWKQTLATPERLSFLQGLTLMSVPERRHPACGMYALESLACGVPLVQPPIGIFPEMAEKAAGGIILAESADPADLAAKMEPLLLDREYARQMGLKGRQAVREHYDMDCNSEGVIDLFRRLYTHPS